MSSQLTSLSATGLYPSRSSSERSTQRAFQMHQREEDFLQKVCRGISELCIVRWLGAHSSESVQPAVTFMSLLLHIALECLLLTTAIVYGDSVQQLAHWTTFQERGDLKVIWTEDLQSTTQAAQTLSDVASFLGLPPFDFSEAVKNRFNTHERPGYETPTAAPAVKDDSAAPSHSAASSKWLKEYFVSHNLALGAQVGEGCSWTRKRTNSTK